MDNGILRPSHRNQERQEAVHAFSGQVDQGRLHDVSVLHLPAPLRKQGKRRSPYQACEKHPSAQRPCRHPLRYRQAVREHGTVRRQERGKSHYALSTARTILK